MFLCVQEGSGGHISLAATQEHPLVMGFLQFLFTTKSGKSISTFCEIIKTFTIKLKFILLRLF